MVHPLDRHIGRRIWQSRLLMGVTQQRLAEQVGIKFQQIQKYESGANRVSASRLWDISQILDVPVSFFFEDYQQDNENGATNNDILFDMLGDREALDLIRFYYAIPDKQRRCLFDLAKVLASVD